MEAILIVAWLVALAGIFRGVRGPARDEFRRAMDGLDDFLPTRTLFGVDGRSALAVDETRRRIALMGLVDDEIEVRTIAFEQLQSCEIIENDEAVSVADRGADEQGRPAAHGDLPHALPGSPVGEVEDVRHVDDSQRSWLVDVLVTVSGSSRLGHRVRLLREGMFQRSIRRGSPLHGAVLQLAQEWFGLCRDILAKPAERADDPVGADYTDEDGKLASLQGAQAPVSEDDEQRVQRMS